jgi:hypothetical protein
MQITENFHLIPKAVWNQTTTLDCICGWLTSEERWQEHINEDTASGMPSWYADYLFVNHDKIIKGD